MSRFLQIVNSEHSISKDYIPNSLIEIVNRENKKVLIDKTAWKNFQLMVDEGVKCGQYLDLTSGYRSFEHQEKTLKAIIARKGTAVIGKLVALPGTSEHQLGLALDVSNFTEDGVMRSDEKRFVWLHQHCYEYGFILRYKKEFEEKTGVAFEPWHLRYVGKEHALKIRDMNIALEDYISIL